MCNESIIIDHNDSIRLLCNYVSTDINSLQYDTIFGLSSAGAQK